MTPPSGPDSAAEAVLEALLRRDPTLGPGRLLCLDGPAGSGKTTLGAACVSAYDAEAGAGAAVLVHMDDLYDGWSGLGTVADQLATLLRPLAEGRPGSYRRYDWHARRFAEAVTVEPAPLLVLEGVGAGSVACADLHTLLVWIEAPSDLRLARGLTRDGEEMRDHWLRWRAEEARHFARDRTRARADVTVDGTGRRPPSVPG